MSLFDSINRLWSKQPPSSASQAKERLQLIIAHQRSSGNAQPDFLPALKQELMAVLAKYVDLGAGDQPLVSFESDDETEMLKIDIVIPHK